MSSGHRHTQKSDINPKLHDPIATTSRNRFNEQPFGRVMHPVQLSLVIGRKGSGVSTLLNAYRQRVDSEGTLIVDEDGKNGIAPPLREGWDSDAITAWLEDFQAQCRANHIVLTASDLRAPRHLLQALAGDPKLATLFRLSAVTGVASALTCTAAAGGVCAASDREFAGAEETARAVDPQLRRLFTIADRIVFTHTDRVRPEMVRQLASVIKALNPPAPILRAINGDIGPARLVDSGLFDPIDGSIDIDRWLCEAAFNFEATRRAASGLNLPESTLARLSNRSGVKFFGITIDQPFDSTVLSVFLKLLMADQGADLLRLKGIVATEDHPDRPALIDGREHIVQPLLWLPNWPTADRRGRLVFATANTSEDWIKTLLTTLSDQLKLHAMPELQLAMVEGA